MGTPSALHCGRLPTLVSAELNTSAQLEIYGRNSHYQLGCENLLSSVFRCSLPKAWASLGVKFSGKSGGGTENEKLPSVREASLPKAMSISRSEIFRKKRRRDRKWKVALGKGSFALPKRMNFRKSSNPTLQLCTWYSYFLTWVMIFNFLE